MNYRIRKSKEEHGTNTEAHSFSFFMPLFIQIGRDHVAIVYKNRHYQPKNFINVVTLVSNANAQRGTITFSLTDASSLHISSSFLFFLENKVAPYRPARLLKDNHPFQQSSAILSFSPHPFSKAPEAYL